MKFFALVEVNNDCKYPQVLNSTHDKYAAFKMILNYYEDKKINGILKNDEFHPDLGEGKWLVCQDKENKNFLIYNVINNGWFFNSYIYEVVGSLSICEYEPVTKDIDDRSELMVELLAKFGFKKKEQINV